MKNSAPGARNQRHCASPWEPHRQCREPMCDGETITAEQIVVDLMRDKRLDADQRLRSDLMKRILRSLDALRRIGKVERIGKGARRAVEISNPIEQGITGECRSSVSVFLIDTPQRLFERGAAWSNLFVMRGAASRW